MFFFSFFDSFFVFLNFGRRFGETISDSFLRVVRTRFSTVMEAPRRNGFAIVLGKLLILRHATDSFH
jgi:hypothetical protein